MLASLPSLTGSCGDNPGIACRLAWDVTHSTSAAPMTGIATANPGKAADVLVVATAMTIRKIPAAQAIADQRCGNWWPLRIISITSEPAMNSHTRVGML